jgi:hypothetical protein
MRFSIPSLIKKELAMNTKNLSWILCWVISISFLSLMCNEDTNPISSPQLNTAPTALTVLSPNGGEAFSLSDSILIRWDMGDSVDLLINQLVFAISLDSGKTFQCLGDIRRNSPFWNAKSIRFSLRDSMWDEQLLVWKTIKPSTGCFIDIYSYTDHSVGDQSDNPFRIN